MFCSNCGKQIDDSALFCPYCGNKRESTESVAEKTNKTQTFIDAKNAEKGVETHGSTTVEGKNKTEAFIAAKQAAPVQQAQPTQQPQPAYIPPAPPAGQYTASGGQPPVHAPATAPKPKKKGLPAWAIVLIILGVIGIVGTVSTIAIRNYVKHRLESLNVVDDIFDDLDDWADEINSSTTAPTEQSNTQTEETTTEAATEPVTEFKSKVDISNVGYPRISDFAWVKTASPSKFPDGSVRLTTGTQVSGRWKAYYVYSDGVKELCNITIAAGDRAAKVAVKPCAINYAKKWESEFKVKGYAYDGSIDEGTITAFSNYGSLALFSFYEYGGKQYAFGKTMVQSGETVSIALVRP